MKFVRVISLGQACDTAFHIRRVLGQPEAYPFDWLVTPFDAVVGLLERRFDGFLDPAQLKGRPKGVLCRRFGIRFLHDWKSAADPMQEYPEIKAKYDRRIARFLEAMETGGPILFIRSCQYADGDVVDAPRAARLHETLSRSFPAVDVHLIAHNPVDAGIPPALAERCSVLPMRQPAVWNWRGDFEAWDELLAMATG
jgi:hypothetical protein